MLIKVDIMYVWFVILFYGFIFKFLVCVVESLVIVFCDINVYMDVFVFVIYCSIVFIYNVIGNMSDIV